MPDPAVNHGTTLLCSALQNYSSIPEILDRNSRSEGCPQSTLTATQCLNPGSSCWLLPTTSCCC
jgi:hypothetical protein